MRESTFSAKPASQDGVPGTAFSRVTSSENGAGGGMYTGSRHAAATSSIAGRTRFLHAVSTVVKIVVLLDWIRVGPFEQEILVSKDFMRPSPIRLVQFQEPSQREDTIG